ncbi:hypothetical protein TNCV_3310331 [Trichonephila clavipes]|uniref:Uncharacterized protein n=1 Tax=Trichonephila clavipes TaxID=2585209 RepID=A0A8X6VH72_TRICX|nr:hypothetical protein TNCV_3310331 [Trichonephila clavipes]
MILRPYSETDDGGMTEGRAGAVDLGDGCAVMILLTYSQTDDGGMREGRAGAVDLGDAGVVMILRPYSETDDGGMREGRAGAVDLGDGGAVMILRPYAKTVDGGMREGPELSILVMVCCDDSPALPQTDDGGMREGRAGAVDLGDGSAVMILRPYSQMDDEGMREGSELLFLVLEVLCRFSGPTPQTDDGGMTEGPDLSFMVMEVQCWVTGPTHKWMMEESGRARAFVYGKGDSCVGSPALRCKRMIGELGRVGPELSFLVLEVLCWFSGLTLQTDDGGMRKGIINDFYTFCYLEYFVRAGLVVHGDGGAVLGHRPYSQMDDGGIREVRREMIKE